MKFLEPAGLINLSPAGIIFNQVSFSTFQAWEYLHCKTSIPQLWQNLSNFSMILGLINF
jgi:hypothetical protein